MTRKALVSGLLSLLFVAAGGNAETGGSALVPVERTGPAFQDFYLGAHVSEFETRLNRGRPVVGSHVKGEERNCAFYVSKTPLNIGGYTIATTDAYFIFYQDKLVRVRIINTFGSYKDESMKYFNDVLKALKDKYGDTESAERIWTRYDGRYIWTKDDLVIDYNFSSLEYTYKPLHDELVREFEKERARIRPSDL